MNSIRFFIATCFIALTGCGGGGSGSGSGNAAPSTYAISGTLTSAGVGVADATMSLSSGATATTDTSGNYSFPGLASGNYTLTPSKTGLVFNPVNATVTVNGANIASTNFVVADAGAAYSQADLTGTWRMTMLREGSINGWLRFKTTVDASGFWTSATVIDNAGISYSLTDNSIKTVINGSGVIAESGTDSVPDGHMTMTSNKKFFAGTGYDGSSQLRIGQKVVPGTVYSNADLQNKSFVYHALWGSSSSYNAAWMHGEGSTDATGLATISSHTNSFGGSAGMNELNGVLLVDADGNVTNSANSHIHGFMSDDKKTIVATDDGSSAGGGIYVIQITGRTYTAGSLSDGVASAHLLAVGAAPAPFWLRYISTAASNGTMTLSDWVSNNPAVTAPGVTFTGTISALGKVSIAENPSFHGQKSDDGKFMVATKTNSTGAFALQVNTN